MAAPSPPLIGQGKRWGGGGNTKSPMLHVPHEGWNGNSSGAPRGHHGGTPLASHNLAPSHGGANKPPTCLLETWVLPRQKATKHVTPNSWDLVPSCWDKMFSAKHFFWKILEGPRTFPGPSKLFWAWSETFPVRWFLSAKSNNGGYGSSETFSIFLSENSQKFPDQFWGPLRISRRVPKPFWPNNNSETTFRFYQNSFDVLSPELFHCLRNFSGDFLSDSLSSIQKIDDP